MIKKSEDLLVTAFLNGLGKTITIYREKVNSNSFVIYEDDRKIGHGKYKPLRREDIVVGFIGGIPLNQKIVTLMGKRLMRTNEKVKGVKNER
jgi:hypothetical protein